MRNLPLTLIFFTSVYLVKVHIFWEGHKIFAKSSPNFWLQYIRSNVRGRFRKILWPSQNIWTLCNYLLHSDRNFTFLSFRRSQQFHFLVFSAMRAEFLSKTYDQRFFKNSTHDMICNYLKHSDRNCIFISFFSQIGRPANMNLPMAKNLKFPGVVKVE